MSDGLDHPQNNLSPIGRARSYRNEWFERGKREGCEEGLVAGRAEGFRQGLRVYHGTIARHNDLTLSELNDRYTRLRGAATDEAWREIMGGQ